jgi:hypothetical protein
MKPLPQNQRSTSLSSRVNRIKLRHHTDLRAAPIGIWLISGITACFVLAPASKAVPSISAAPNPVIYMVKPKPPLLLLNQGKTTITWDAGAGHGGSEVWVSVDGSDETLFAANSKGSKDTVIGFGKAHTFKLWNYDKSVLWDSVSVTTKHYPFIENVDPEEHGTFAKIRFTTKENSLPVVSVSTKQPLLNFPLVSTKDEQTWSDPDDIAYTNFAQTGTHHEAQLNKLEPGTVYWYVISAHDKKSGLRFKRWGFFKTLKRMVTVNFRKLWITDDSDSSGDGELRFGFYINGQSAAKYPSGSGYAGLSTDQQKTINRTVTIANPGSTLTLKATGYDNDNVAFGGDADSTGSGFPANNPNLGTGEGENGEWTSTSQTINVNNRDPVDKVGPTFFKLVATEAHDSDLEFEVHGEYTISYAR